MGDPFKDEIRVNKTGDFQGLTGSLAGKVMHVTMIMGSLERQYAHTHAATRDLQMATRYTGITYQHGDLAKASADLRDWLVQHRADEIPVRHVEVKLEARTDGL